MMVVVKIAKIVSLLLVVVMSVFSLVVLLGIANFYTAPISLVRSAAFFGIVAAPIVSCLCYVFINARLQRPLIGFTLIVVLFLCDLALVQIANGRW